MALSRINANSITDDSITVDQIADTAVHGRRNLIINGAMQVAQRSTSVTSITGSDYHTMDRWKIDLNNLGTWSFSQSSTAPDGFANSYKLDCTTADASPAAGDHLILQQRFEGQNLQMLKKGTSAAESVTVSFYIRSSVTGTYTCELYDNDNGGRYVGKTFTVDAANTWERKAITFPGDTTGTLDDDNALSFFCQIWFGAGSNFNGGTFNDGTWGAGGNNTRVSSSNVNLASSTSNEAYVTGWQMEVGDKATPFEHRSFAEELNLCQRYFQRLQDPTLRGVFSGQLNGGASRLAIPTYTKLRANPTISMSGTFNFWNGGDVYTGSSASGTFAAPDGYEIDITINTTTNLTKGMAAVSYTTNSTTKIIDLDAEL